MAKIVKRKPKFEKYIPTERQRIAHESTAKFRLYGGAMGGGKSKWLCMEVLRLCWQYDGNFIVMARQHLVDFRNSTLRTLLQSIPYNVYYEHNKSEHTITFQNGSEILYMGLSDETDVMRFKSMEFGTFAFDEASEIDKEQFDLAVSRLRYKLPNGKRPPYLGLLTSNPEDCWLKDDFIRNPKKGYHFIPALPKDNPHLHKDYEASLRERFPEDWVRRYIEGSWDDLTEGSFVIPRHLIDQAVKKELPDGMGFVAGVDVSRGVGADENVIIVGDGGKMIDAYYDAYADTQKTAHKTHVVMNQYDCGCVCVDDTGVGAGVTDYLKKYNIGDVVKPINSSCRSENDKFFKIKAEMWWHAREMFEKGQVSIFDDKLLIRQLAAVKYRLRNGKIMIEFKEETKKRISCSPDRADALILMLWASKFYVKREQDSYIYDEDEAVNSSYGWDKYYTVYN